MTPDVFGRLRVRACMSCVAWAVCVVCCGACVSYVACLVGVVRALECACVCVCVDMHDAMGCAQAISCCMITQA